MNTYPVLPWIFDQEESVGPPEVINEATDGFEHQVILGPDDHRSFSIVHPRLTRAEYDTWMAFRAANLGQEFIFERPRGGIVESYVLKMSAKFKEKYQTPGLFTITVRLFGK